MVKIPGFHHRGCGFDPCFGNKDPACRTGQPKKYTNKVKKKKTLSETKKNHNNLEVPCTQTVLQASCHSYSPINKMETINMTHFRLR